MAGDHDTVAKGVLSVRTYIRTLGGYPPLGFRETNCAKTTRSVTYSWGPDCVELTSLSIKSNF